MRLPFYLGIPGFRVPDWLETLTPIPGEEARAIVGTLRFGGFSIVTRRHGQYRMRTLFGGVLLKIDRAQHCVLKGHSPPGSDKPVLLDLNPIIKPSEIAALIAVVVYVVAFLR